jgi:hypothetical protein
LLSHCRFLLGDGLSGNYCLSWRFHAGRSNILEILTTGRMQSGKS